MALSKEEIAKLATLSRLSFPDDKLTTFAAEFNNILGFVEQISAVDTKGVEPLTCIGNQPTSPERTDTAAPKADPAAHQVNAPKAEMGFYVVPQIVE